MTSPILKDDIRENTVSQYFPGAGFEVWPLPRFFFRLFRNNAGDDAVTLSQFHGFSCPQPALQALCIAKLADIHGMHIIMCHIMCHIVKNQLLCNGVDFNVGLHKISAFAQ